jgi:hypothetical protein
MMKPIIAIIVSLGALNTALVSGESSDPKKTVELIRKIIAEKQVAKNRERIVSWLKQDPAFEVQCACVDAIEQSKLVSPELRDELMALLITIPSMTPERRQNVWLALLSQASVTSDDNINNLLNKLKEAEYNFVFELAGMASIENPTRKRILKYADNTTAWWSSSVLTFIRLQLGLDKKPGDKARLDEQIHQLYVTALHAYTQARYVRATRVLSAITLLKLGHKDVAKDLASIFQDDQQRLKSKAQSLLELMPNIQAVDSIAEGKFKSTLARDEQGYERAIDLCIKWLQDQ